MPLPKPKSKEKQKEFVSRCAGNPTMNKEYPETAQRVAICYSLYRQAQKKKSAKGSDDEPEWEETCSEIEATQQIVTDGEVRVIKIFTQKAP